MCICRLSISDNCFRRVPTIDLFRAMLYFSNCSLFDRPHHFVILSSRQDAAGDFDLRCPTVMAARHFAGLGQPTYLYSFDHAPFESINWPGQSE